jgi:ATP dependent DNA ligase-like protein
VTVGRAILPAAGFPAGRSRRNSCSRPFSLSRVAEGHAGFIHDGRCRLISKNGKAYQRYDRLAADLARLVESAILDGELVCLGPDGKPQFSQMMRTSECAYFAFDLVWLNGRDLRPEPWIKRQKLLQPLHRAARNFVVADHILGRGKDLFELVCAENLEGIVAKRRLGPYGEEWLKIRNPHYTQMGGHREFFLERSRAASAAGPAVQRPHSVAHRKQQNAQR